ncbi:MAG: hypothetical protein OHK0046_17830 [Anaerolineae bacterium]
MKTALALLFVCLVFVPSVLLAQDAPTDRYMFGDDFTVEPCPAEAESFPLSITCGYLAVSENRTNPDSRTIEIAVAIVHTPHPERQTPLVVLGGGPGSELISPIFSAPELGAALAAQRDVILIEQRGVGYSRPRLDCPNEAAILLKDDAEAVRTCYETLTAAGADLTGYNSIEAAADVEALRVALGLDEWNVLGGSYGTRWALTVARNYPEGVRSLVLDGVFPPQMNFEVWMRAIPGVIDRLVAACAADGACDSAYPDLAATLRQTITSLNAEPLTVLGEPFTGDRLTELIINFMYEVTLIPRIPALIAAAAQGDAAAVEAALPAEVTPPDPSDADAPLNSGIATYHSVQCNEEIAFADRPTFMQQLEEVDPLVAAVARISLIEFAGCDMWQSGEAPAVENTPVISEIPTLILNGEFDPATPMADGYLAAETLDNVTVLDFPGIGHTVMTTGECPLRLIDTFLTTLDGAALDTSCITADYGAPEFVLRDTRATGEDQSLQENPLIAALQAQLDGEIEANPDTPGQLLTVIAPQAGLEVDLAAGVIDFVSGSPLEPGATFRLASVTKTFTAAAVLRLVEMGQVDLDASIAQYISAESIAILQTDGYATDRITVRQLLLHTSGIADFASRNPAYVGALFENPSREWTRAEQIQFAVDTADPVGEPGAQYSYSDTGYSLLGELIERQTGQQLGAAVRELLDFERLGLSGTYWEQFEDAPAGAIMAHQYAGELDITTMLHPSADLYGAGGLVSTTRDLTLFYRALLRGEVFESSDTLETMLTIPETNISTDGGTGDAAMGIYRLSGGGLTCWLHTGSWGVLALYCPEIDLAVARSINQMNNTISMLDVINTVALAILDN